MKRDCAVVGFEALVRWQHPSRGLLAPASFIALAEETGLIVPLGRWVMSTAAAEVSRWSALLAGKPFSLSVNLAAKQLTDPGLVEQVREVVAGAGSWQLWLELTESTLMQDLLLELWSGSGAAVVFVTHDLTEAVALADTVVVMTAGPATVKSSVPVPLERPRKVEEIRLTPEFIELYRHIWDSLRTEVELTRARGAGRAA